MQTRLLALAALLACAAAAHREWRTLDAAGKLEYTFDDYVAEFNRAYRPGTPEHGRRRIAFETNLREIHRLNARPDATWVAGVNHMTDWTPEEFKRLLGYRKNVARSLRMEGTHPRFEASAADAERAPLAMDWRNHGVVTAVKDQGMCGSCWAFGSTETIESHVALNPNNGVLMVLSPQQLVACALNPDHCGGVGGCQGSIPELAFDYVRNNGMTTEWYMPYTSHDGKTCSPSCKCTYNNATAAVTIDGYRKLKENDYNSVLTAISTVGPLAVNVQANTWQHYESGVFPVSGCDANNTDIDHVVQLVGYGEDDDINKMYWTIRNSWTPLWGEKGYIRLERETNPTCTPDVTPADGTGCSGGPSKVTVCGTCGVLYDTSFPVNARVVKH